ncbi:unnamed protein product, partial [Prorocentrum cordatum]
HSPVDASGQEVCQPPDVDDDATSFRESCEPRRGAVARLESWRRRRARRPLARQRRRAALRCAAAAPRKEGGGRRGRSWADTDHALAAAERIREVNLSTCFWPVRKRRRRREEEVLRTSLGWGISEPGHLATA